MCIRDSNMTDADYSAYFDAADAFNAQVAANENALYRPDQLLSLIHISTRAAIRVLPNTVLRLAARTPISRPVPALPIMAMVL